MKTSGRGLEAALRHPRPREFCLSGLTHTDLPDVEGKEMTG